MIVTIAGFLGFVFLVSLFKGWWVAAGVLEWIVTILGGFWVLTFIGYLWLVIPHHSVPCISWHKD